MFEAEREQVHGTIVGDNPISLFIPILKCKPSTTTTKKCSAQNTTAVRIRETWELITFRILRINTTAALLKTAVRIRQAARVTIRILQILVPMNGCLTVLVPMNKLTIVRSRIVEIVMATTTIVRVNTNGLLKNDSPLP
jgi:hypothetical protein